MDRKLDAVLHELLLGHPQGLAEHALLKQLQADAQAGFPDSLFNDELALFRAHFLLFHALYRLRDALAAERSGHLQIDARCIRLLPYQLSDASHMAEHDPLADYYLDLHNLENTTAEDLAQMLGNFWTRYYADSRREEALAELGLQVDADLATAQRRYRELAMVHHPDRGGEAGRFQAIREAIDILRHCLDS